MSAVRNPPRVAKNESTAVNDLIKIASTQARPRDPSEASDDLMFAIPPKGKPLRMTGSTQPARGIEDVPPLPRTRAPNGTHQHASIMPALRPSTPAPRASAPELRASSPALRPPAPPLRPSAPALRPSAPPLPPPAAAMRPSAPALRPSVPPPAAVAPQFRAMMPSEVSIDPSVDVDLESDTSYETIAKRETRPSLPPPTRAVATTSVKPLPYPPRGSVPSFRPMPPPRPSQPIEVQESPWLDGNHAAAAIAPSLPVAQDPWLGGTAKTGRGRTTLEWLTKLAPVMGIAIAIGVGVGAYLVVRDSKGDKRADRPGAVVPVAPVQEPAAAPVATAPAALEAAASAPVEQVAAPVAPVAQPTRVALVDVRIDSKPMGATVTLVDRGTTRFLGTTPISTAVDPSRAYDVVVAYDGRASQREHFDPRTTTRLAIELGKAAKTATSAKVAPTAMPAAPAPVAHPAKAVRSAKIEKTAAEPAVATTKAAIGGDGVLMISSKPPCEIHVDGKPTGLTTPQRALKLSAGKHKITLINADEKLEKTFGVDISPDAPTKVIQDLMKH